MSTVVVMHASEDVNQNLNSQSQSEPLGSKPVVAICSHIKDNGIRCGTPAIHGRPFCYYHSRAHAPASRFQSRYRAPVPETVESLQLIIQQVVEALGSGPITDRVAGKLLYAVQLSTNLLKMKQAAAQSLADGAQATHSEGLSELVDDSNLEPTSVDPQSPGPQNATSSLVSAAVTEIPEAMLRVLDPPPEQLEQDDPNAPTVAASVPIYPHTWHRLTSNLMTEAQIAEIRPALMTGTEEPGYVEALKQITAHYDAVRELHSLGMSTQHPRLRKWFPKEDWRSAK